MSRRAALLGRFRATALDRLRRADLALIELGDGAAEGAAARVEEIARELHTIKGEARMLGQGPLSDLVHGTETRLLQIRDGGDPGACGALRRELAAIEAALRAEAPPPTSLPPRPEGGLPAPADGAPAPGPEPAPAAAPVEPQARWVQVDAARIDELCERISGFQAELRLLITQIREVADGGDRRLRLLVEGGERSLAQLDDITSAAWELRLVPIGPMLEDLGRHARELAEGLGKRVRAAVRGGEAQIERAVLDEIRDPLLHLVRNAVDHGLEAPEERGDKGPEGRLQLSAEPVGRSLLITVSDDGRGVDPQAVRRAAVQRGLLGEEAAAALSDGEARALVFAHGFSTRARVSDLSGRGVGLDVVRRVVESMGGAVSLESERGRGSRFLLTVPVHVGTERAVVFGCEGALYAIAARSVAEVLRVADHPIESVAGGQLLRCRGEALPLRSVTQTLLGAAAEEPMVLVVEHGGRHHAFSVPQLVGEYDLLRRPADPVLGRLEFLSASAVLDDGRLVLLLTVGGLLRRAEGQRSIYSSGHAAGRGAGHAERPAPRVLVVDDSAIIRDLVCHVLRSGGLEVQEAPEARAALQLLAQGEPDAVLLDVDMPGMNGFELLAAIRGRSKELPVIMFTTRFSEGDQRRAAALGADAYLVKSQFQEATLLETVRRFARAQGMAAP